jgi:hypothetical protein
MGQRTMLALAVATTASSDTAGDIVAEIRGDPDLCGDGRFAVVCRSGDAPPEIEGIYARAGQVMDATLPSLIGLAIDGTVNYYGQADGETQSHEYTADMSVSIFGSGAILGADTSFTVYQQVEATVGTCTQRSLLVTSGTADAATLPSSITEEGSLKILEVSGSCQAGHGDMQRVVGTLTLSFR